ncbi:MAG: nucleoside phosphorylase [Actinomycetia bacterium]|nr:nucleoside phosphorylase [Actinomycetes bacterium]
MTGDTNLSTIAILAAMQPELKPLVRRLGLVKQRLGDVDGYRAEVRGVDVIAAVTGIGTTRATDVTGRVLDAVPVQHVVVIGICGGIDGVSAVGDVIVPESVLNGITGNTYQPTAIPGTTPAGTLHTSDVLVGAPDDLAALVARGVIALDMETAAIGAAAEARGLPWSCVRGVSDIAGDTDDEILAMSGTDGSGDARAVARFLMKHPARVRQLGRLARGMRVAVDASVTTALNAYVP